MPPPAIPPTVREEAAEPPSGHRTPNFVVEAPTRRVAQLVAEAAEQQRKAQALRWLGEEMPPWPEPCRIRVSFAPAAPLVGVARPASGASTFAFDKGKVQRQGMELQGPLDQLLSSTLPHEITHIVLAHHFGEAVPRWADEGAAVLAEDEEDRRRHDDLARQVLGAPKRRIPLRRLLPMRDYPEDVMALFAEGYALTRFLVERKDRATFLAFVKQGMRDGWDQAARAHYGYEDVEVLEKDLVAKVGSPRGNEPASADSLPAGQPPITVLAVLSDDRVVVRMPGTVYEPRTSYVRREGEPERAVTSYVLVPGEQVREFAAGAIQAFDTDGERVGTKVLAGLLRKQTAVLFAPDGRKPDPFHLQLVKEGTVILVPPAPRPPVAAPAPAGTPQVEPPPRRGN